MLNLLKNQKFLIFRFFYQVQQIPNTKTLNYYSQSAKNLLLSVKCKIESYSTDY